MSLKCGFIHWYSTLMQRVFCWMSQNIQGKQKLCQIPYHFLLLQRFKWNGIKCTFPPFWETIFCRAETGKLYPAGQIWPTACFFMWSFVGTQSYPFIYVLSVAVFCATAASWVVVTETVWPGKPKMFTVWPSTEKVCQAISWVFYFIGIYYT